MSNADKYSHAPQKKEKKNNGNYGDYLVIVQK